MSDNIVEGNEMFRMRLIVPSSLGPGIIAGTVDSATGIILDSTGKFGLKIINTIAIIAFIRHICKVYTSTIHWFRR